MGDVESAITDLISEWIEHEVKIPSDEDIENTAESAAESYLDRNLSDQVSQTLRMENSVRATLAELFREFMDVEKVVKMKDLENLQKEFSHVVEAKSLRFRVKKLGRKIKSRMGWLFMGCIQKGTRVWQKTH